ncbi:MAG: hypothetical protein Q9191_000115 [Dirinaria sp. TL-2023a]
MTSNGPKPARSGLSLYANLLDPSSSNSAAPGTISRGPVVFNKSGGEQPQQDESSAQKQQISAASLRFQPTKRPQLSAQKAKAKPAGQKPVSQTSVVGNSAATPPDAVGGIAKPPPKNTLADWTADADDDINGFYGAEKRQRGGRKKRKKNKEEVQIPQNWDDIYDPSRPNNYEEYKHSDEKISEIREWKDRLYAHRIQRRSSSDSEEENYRPQMSSKWQDHPSPKKKRLTAYKEQFAPPAMSFAPPQSLEDNPSPPPPPPAELPNDPTGEDAYMRRMRLSQPGAPPDRPASPVQQPFEPPPPPPPSVPATETVQAQPSSQPTSAAPPPPTISRAPVRYQLPPAPSELPESEAELQSALQNEESEDRSPEPAADAPRSLRPGQKGFAERLMSKYGWTKGSGLGANNTGIVNPLRAQVVKQKKKPDSEGGGFVGPGGMGKIIGGKKKGGKGDEGEGKFGAMSEVIVLRGMIDGMDLDAELEGAGEGGLMQEIGEECAEKAVNALEGRIFNGNNIVARFYDTEKFENGIYSW